jgi:hypothetical protein
MLNCGTGAVRKALMTIVLGVGSIESLRSTEIVSDWERGKSETGDAAD